MSDMYGPKHIRGPQRRVRKEPSITQRKRRNAFRTCLKFWPSHGQGRTGEEWKNFAIPPETAWNAYLRINLVRAFNGLHVLHLPPRVS